MALVANYNSSASAQEELICPSGEVAFVRTTNPNPVCIDENTAMKWEGYGMGEIVGEASEPEEAPATPQQNAIDLIMAKIAAGEKLSTSEVRALEKHVQETEIQPMKEEFYGTAQTGQEAQGAVSVMQGGSLNNVLSDTFTSVQDPGVGHEGHQIMVILPPSDDVYVGRLTFSASEPVQYVTIHGPLDAADLGGQPTWSPDGGETHYALTFIDNGLRNGGWYFAGNALALHTMGTTPFTATVNVAYAQIADGVYHKGTVSTGTVQSIPDPGIGHESHSLALILPPREIPYQGGVLSYSASENVQIVSLMGPLESNDMVGQATWSPDGETFYALTLIDTGTNMGVENTISGNAIALHTMNPDGFTATYSIAGLH
jgi:hypothetical protein